MSPNPTGLPCTARFFSHHQHFDDTHRVSKRWRASGAKLLVSFLTNPGAELEERIVSHLNAWSKTSNVLFKRASWNDGRQVRISIAPGGHWSFVGTDILLLPADKATTNLDGLSLSTPEAELARLVRHLAGYLLGFGNENLRQEVLDRIDRPRAYTHLAVTQGWPPHIVDAWLFTPLEQESQLSTPAQDTSIMSYQLPAHIMRDGQAYLGGPDIVDSDYRFAELMYPRRPWSSNPLETS